MLLLFRSRGQNQGLRVAWQMEPRGDGYRSNFKILNEGADYLCSCTIT